MFIGHSKWTNKKKGSCYLPEVPNVFHVSVVASLNCLSPILQFSNTRYAFWCTYVISDNLTYKQFNKFITIRVDCGELSLWSVNGNKIRINNPKSYVIWTNSCILFEEMYNVTSPFNQWRDSKCLKTPIHIFNTSFRWDYTYNISFNRKLYRYLNNKIHFLSHF